MKEITSPSNPQIKLAGKLRRRRHRQTHGLCLLEGIRLVQDALAMGAIFRACFLTAPVAAAEPNLIAKLEQMCPVYLVAGKLLNRISDTVTPQSIVTITALPELPLPQVSDLTCILDGVQDPGNGGTLLRTAAAAGADQVLFGPGCVDPFNTKVLRAAMGAHFRVPVRVLHQWQAVWEILSDEQAVYVADAEGSILYDHVDWNRPSVLVVGSEAHGPSPESREKGTTIAIPMTATTESLNVAMAAAIILFEAARQHRWAR